MAILKTNDQNRFIKRAFILNKKLAFSHKPLVIIFIKKINFCLLSALISRSLGFLNPVRVNLLFFRFCHHHVVQNQALESMLCG